MVLNTGKLKFCTKLSHVAEVGTSFGLTYELFEPLGSSVAELCSHYHPGWVNISIFVKTFAFNFDHYRFSFNYFRCKLSQLGKVSFTISRLVLVWGAFQLKRTTIQSNKWHLIWLSTCPYSWLESVPPRFWRRAGFRPVYLSAPQNLLKKSLMHWIWTFEHDSSWRKEFFVPWSAGRLHSKLCIDLMSPVEED